MALVTLSGFPCAGKSTRAQELRDMFEARQVASSDSSGPPPKRRKVVIVNDESLGIARAEYDDSKSERPARANLFAATVRSMNKDSIVICDGLNYIKGFRYQLYCAAREAGVRICTVHVACPENLCLERNSLRPSDSPQRYSDPTIANLISRFEEPSAAVRWDSPLVTLPWCDPLWEEQREEVGGLAGRLQGLKVLDDRGNEIVNGPRDARDAEDDAGSVSSGGGAVSSLDDRGSASASASPLPPSSPSLPAAGRSASPQPEGPAPNSVNGSSHKAGRWSAAADAIYAAITSSAVKPQHASTVPNVRSSTNYLHLLESLTSEVVKALGDCLSASPVAVGAFKVPVSIPSSPSSPEEVEITLSPTGKRPSLPTLLRIKRQYVVLRKQKLATGYQAEGSGGEEAERREVREFARHLEVGLR